MTVTEWIVLALIAIALLLLVWFFFDCFIPLYNELVRLRETCYQAKADIDAMRKQRRELLPQVVTVAKTYSQFESGTIGNVAIRKAASQRARFPAESPTGNRTGFLMGWADARALGDRWPELKANDQYDRLMETATMLTLEIYQAWEGYNGAAREYNTLRSSIWGSVVAFMSGCFPPLDYLDAPSERNQVIRVDMGDPLHPLALAVKGLHQQPSAKDGGEGEHPSSSES